ncbi:MAG: hypothetical protein KDD89_04020, partial [Anaerolineales bacterium]|nr:hypothetical protein [Anaerolineales bacterium]
TDVSPAQKFVSETDTVTISGTGFQVGATVELTDGTNSYMLTVTDETTTTLTVTVPDTVAISVYDVVVTNPDTQAATAVDAYTVLADPVTVFTSYLPIITR